MIGRLTNWKEPQISIMQKGSRASQALCAAIRAWQQGSADSRQGLQSLRGHQPRRLYQLAGQVGISASTLSAWHLRICFPQVGDKRVIRLGRLLGLTPGECWAATHPAEREAYAATFVDDATTGDAA